MLGKDCWIHQRWGAAAPKLSFDGGTTMLSTRNRNGHSADSYLKVRKEEQLQRDVIVLRTVDELESIRVPWQSWPGHRDSDLDYYLTVLRSNPATVRPHILLARRNGVPDAILVGRLDNSHIDYRVGYSHWRIHASVLYFVYGALRGNTDADNCKLLVSAVQRDLGRGEADAAYLNLLRTDSMLYELTRQMPGFLTRDYNRMTQPHFSAALPASVDDLYRGLSPKARKNQKWQARRLLKQFDNDIRVRCFRTLSEIPELIADAEEVASKSYQRGLGVGFINDCTVRERLYCKCRHGWLRGYVLYLAARPVAFWIGDINEGIFHSDFLGYDPAFGEYSPGSYLVLNVMETFCGGSEGVTAVDFGPGAGQYKQMLSTRSWSESPLYIFRPSLKGYCLCAARTLAGGIDGGVKRALARTGLLARTKKLWRTRVTPGPTEAGQKGL